MEYVEKIKMFVKDHTLMVAAAGAVAVIAVAYVFVRSKKYCPRCKAWVSQLDETCPYCDQDLKK